MMSACITLASSSSFISGDAVNTPASWFASASWSPRRKSASLFLYRAVTPPKIVALSKITGAKKPSGGIMQPRPVSPAMQTFLGVKEISRTQALKQIWGYIKDNNLQDPTNRRFIMCDEQLKTIFGGRDRIGFLEVSGLLNPHFSKQV